MKKALVVLLILAVAGGLFAQELTWTGQVKTGLTFTAVNDGDDDDDNDPDPTIEFFNDDADTATRFQLGASYTNGNYGAVFRLRADIASGTAVNYSAYAWGKFVNDMLKVSAGTIHDGVWGTGGYKNWDVGGNGVRFEVTPLAGLNLGVIFRVPANTLKDIKAEDFFNETAFGANYKSDLFSIGGAVFLDSKGDVNAQLETIEKAGLEDAFGDSYKAATGKDFSNRPTPTPDTGDAADADDGKGIVAQMGVSVSPIPGLKISAEGRGRNLGDFDKYGYWWFNEQVTYQVLEKLEVAVLAKQFIFGKDLNVTLGTGSKELKPHLQFIPSVGYDLFDNLNIGLEATIGAWQDVYKTELNFTPGLTYTVGKGASVGAYYDLGIKTPDYDKADTVTTHQVHVEVIWTF
jgi:hypothetical protein